MNNSSFAASRDANETLPGSEEYISLYALYIMSSGTRRTLLLIDAGTAVSSNAVGGTVIPAEVIFEGINSWAARLKVSVYFLFVSPLFDVVDLLSVGTMSFPWPQRLVSLGRIPNIFVDADDADDADGSAVGVCTTLACACCKIVSSCENLADETSTILLL